MLHLERYRARLLTCSPAPSLLRRHDVSDLHRAGGRLPRPDRAAHGRRDTDRRATGRSLTASTRDSTHEAAVTDSSQRRSLLLRRPSVSEVGFGVYSEAMCPPTRLLSDTKAR